MSKTIKHIITDHTVVICFDGKTHSLLITDPLAQKVISAIKDGKTDDIPRMFSVGEEIDKYSKGTFKVVDGAVYTNDVEASELLSKKIIKFMQEGLPYEPLVKFAEKIQKNPSKRSVEQLYSFLEHNDHPITEDGNFIAYKKVGSDFLDLHSRSMDNSPGSILEMPRSEVDDDPNRTCSRGLHVANWDYAANKYGGSGPGVIMLEVEINPADVVAVPVDYNQSKMRVCKYKVIGVVNQEESIQLKITKIQESQANYDDSDLEDTEDTCEDYDDEEYDEEELDEEDEEYDDSSDNYDDSDEDYE